MLRALIFDVDGTLAETEELHRRANSLDASISLATVYRTVKLFEDAGIIQAHDFRDGRARYEEVPEEHHDHLINVKTGAVVEFHSEEIEKLQEEIALKLGFRLIDAIEASGIDPCEVAPDHWRHIHNRLAAREASRGYSLARHRAWLQRKALLP